MENRTELPQDVALLLSRLQAGLAARGDLVGVYVYGSLATGDYSPACSDIDVIIMVEREPDKAALRELAELHKALLTSSGGAAERLNCLYVPVEAGPDPDRLHNYWFGNRMTQWQLKVMTQAELVSAGGALYGPWPPPGIAPVPVEVIQAAVYEEITGYWRHIAGRARLWLQDTWVDHALTVLPRAEEVLATGDLITKSEAISRFTDFGVPESLAQEIRHRRDGQAVTLSIAGKIRRAYTARRIMKRGVRKLSSWRRSGAADCGKV
jgi:predicted nucleotidyltransferase